MSEKAAIKVNNLTKSYEGFKLNDISFEIPKGTIVGFVGENGAGKSTTIKSILGLTPIETGEIEILGNQIGVDEKDVSWKEQIGVVFDECNFPSALTINQIVKFERNIYKTWNDDKFTNYVKRFDLPLKKKISEFSKGMKMKLSIAVALSHDTKLLILDEATSGLDPVIRNEILDIFREFVEDEERAVFISSHITSDIEKISDYIMLIHKGNLLFMESKDELIYNYALVKCSREHARQIPKKIVVGIEDNAFETTVLIRDKKSLLENGFLDNITVNGMAPIIERASVEDILLYIVKAEGKEARG